MQDSAGNQCGQLEWRDGVPVSTQFADPYYSLNDGLAETHHVFLQGNGLPERFCDGFHIAELGVGTGLNLLAAGAAWLTSGRAGTLRYTGFEAFPMPAHDAALALVPFRQALSGSIVDDMLSAWNTDGFTMTVPGFQARMIVGDARQTLPTWDDAADAWFLDGFAPARNPELWEPGLLAQVAHHTRPGGTFATYTAAGAVRRALAHAGFDVARVPGYGRKRHMTRGSLQQP